MVYEASDNNSEELLNATELHDSCENIKIAEKTEQGVNKPYFTYNFYKYTSDVFW